MKSRVATFLGALIAVAIFAWFARAISANWDEVSVQLAQASLRVLGLSVLLILIFTVLVSHCYYSSLRLAGAEVRRFDAMGVYMASQLGKYVPGKVLYVAGQMGLARWLGIPVTKSALGFTAHHVFLVGTGALMASPLLGVVMGQGRVTIMIVLAVLGFAVLASGAWVKPVNYMQARRNKPEFEALSPMLAISALLSSATGWFFYGCFAAVISSALVPDWTPTMLAQIGMAAVSAWLLGFLSFIAPTGAGVREGTFVLLTQSILPETTAMAVALIMRLVHTGVQIPTGALLLAHSMRKHASAVERKDA